MNRMFHGLVAIIAVTCIVAGGVGIVYLANEAIKVAVYWASPAQPKELTCTSKVGEVCEFD